MILYHHLAPITQTELSLRIPLFSYFSIWSTAKRQNSYSPPRVCVTLLQCQKHNFWLHQPTLQFLGTFAKLRKVTATFVMSVCPSVHLHGNNSAPTGRIFMKFDIRVFFENLSRKFKSHLNLTRITSTLHEDLHTFFSYLAQLLLEWETFLTIVTDKIKTKFVFNNFFPPKIVPFLKQRRNKWLSQVGHR